MGVRRGTGTNEPASRRRRAIIAASGGKGGSPPEPRPVQNTDPFITDRRGVSMIARTLARVALLLAASSVAAGAAHAQFRLSSPDVKPGGTIAAEQVFNGFGCSGQNVSPALKWTGAPKGTKGFALLVHDPDAPTGGAGWWHWVVFNLPASTTGLPKGAGKSDGSALPAGAASGVTDFGSAGYGGPCPPAGDKPHRYNFTVYALNTDKLDVPKGATAALIGFMVNASAIGKATLTGMYGRKK
jgi:Raf kinase inhibitor-like YbhB/YbcL family protein